VGGTEWATGAHTVLYCCLTFTDQVDKIIMVSNAFPNIHISVGSRSDDGQWKRNRRDGSRSSFIWEALCSAHRPPSHT